MWPEKVNSYGNWVQIVQLTANYGSGKLSGETQELMVTGESPEEVKTGLGVDNGNI